ncbi:hypothetical protein [Amycolatopsis minnesotensis]|uniref:Uncharacterized protein n=1 Tax=Amycolatopsis minnesotensis TaxID=337894 RepID=A0ABN2RUT3_9PSEU
MTLPPRRELPDDVRERMRAAVRHGMAEPRPRRRGSAVLAAAAVVVLAAGAVTAVTMTRAARDSSPAVPRIEPPPPGFTLDTARANAQLDRCWDALGTAGNRGSYPDRDRWRPVFEKSSDPAALDGSGVQVVAVRADDRVLFCETTATSATVSADPMADAVGFPAGISLFSASGTIAGSAGPGIGSLRVTGRTGISSGADTFGIDVSVGDGLFVAFAPAKPVTGIEVSVAPASVAPPPGRNIVTTGVSQARYPVPKLRQAWAVVDRPRAPAPDRASPEGRLLGACLASTGVSFDAASYAPAARLEANGAALVMGQAQGRVIACARSAGPGQPFYSMTVVPYPETAGAVRAKLWSGIDGAKALVGSAPVAGAKITLDFGGGVVAEAPIVDGTFAAAKPAGLVEDRPLRCTAVVTDARGRPLAPAFEVPVGG